MSEKPRQSYVEKKLEFLINVDNFESLKVGTTFGETIEWSSPEERQNKLNSLSSSLASEVAKDAKEILKFYGLKRKSNHVLDAKNKKEFDDINEILEEDDENFEL